MTAPRSDLRAELAALAGSAGLGIVGKGLSRAIHYLFIFVLARTLSVETLDAFFLALGLVTISSHVCLLGLDRAILRFAAIQGIDGDLAPLQKMLGLAASISFLTSLALTGLLYLGSSGPFKEMLKLPYTESILRIMVFALPFHTLMHLTLSTTRGFRIMRITTLTEDLALPIVKLGTFIALVAVFDEVLAVGASHVLAVTLASVLGATLLWKLMPRWSTTRRSESISRPLLASSLPLAVASLAGYSYAWLGALILGYQGAGGEVTVYQLSLRTTFLLIVLSMPVNQMLAPLMSSLYSSARLEELAQTYRSVTRWVFTLSAPLSLSMALFAGEWLRIFGATYQVGAACLTVLAGATLVNVSLGPTFWLLQMTGHQVRAMIAALVFILAQTALVGWFAVDGGAQGAAIGTAISVGVFGFLLLSQTRLSLGIRLYDRAMVKPLLALAGSFLLGLFLRSSLLEATVQDPYLRLVIGSLAVAGIYLVLLLSQRIDSSDWELINTVRQKLYERSFARQERPTP